MAVHSQQRWRPVGHTWATADYFDWLIRRGVSEEAGGVMEICGHSGGYNHVSVRIITKEKWHAVILQIDSLFRIILVCRSRQQQLKVKKPPLLYIELLSQVALICYIIWLGYFSDWSSYSRTKWLTFSFRLENATCWRRIRLLDVFWLWHCSYFIYMDFNTFPTSAAC